MQEMQIDQTLSSSAQVLMINLFRKNNALKNGVLLMTEADIIKITMFQDKDQALQDIDELKVKNYLTLNADQTLFLTETGLTEGDKLSRYERSFYWADV